MSNAIKNSYFSLFIIKYGKYFVPLQPKIGSLILKESRFEDSIQQSFVLTINLATFEGFQVNTRGLLRRVAHTFTDI